MNERKIWSVFLDAETGRRFVRDAKLPAVSKNRYWYLGRAPALMTKAEAESWANALSSLGQAPEPGKEPALGWRTDMTPLPKDSPILVREPGDRDRPMSLLYWNETWARWEIGDVFLQGAPLAPGVLEWIPLTEYRGQP